MTSNPFYSIRLFQTILSGFEPSRCFTCNIIMHLFKMSKSYSLSSRNTDSILVLATTPTYYFRSSS